MCVSWWPAAGRARPFLFQGKALVEGARAAFVALDTIRAREPARFVVKTGAGRHTQEPHYADRQRRDASIGDLCF